ncbi:MAG: outer membrane protein assembly factor BamA, partial [candidate division WOR-3 bacterium]
MILYLFLINLVISDIKVDSRWTDTDLIIESSGLKVGAEFKERMLGEAILNLNKLRLFNFVALDTTIIADGIFIKIMVDEAPFLSGKPEFVGNKAIKDKDLEKKIELKEGQVLTHQRLFEAKRKILDLYAEKNFYNTEIGDSLIHDTLNRVHLVFNIKEGISLRIKRIIIDGNHIFSDGAIKRKMQTKQKGFLRSGKLDRNKLKEDIEKIKTFYKENGFLDVIVEEPKIEINEQGITIVIQITENRRYYIGDISYTGNILFTTQQLEKIAKLNTGDIYNLTRMQNIIQKYYEMYADEGYIYCTIVPVENVRDSFIDIEYNIREGQPANINRIIITGNYRTREKVIRREILTIPGERFRRSLVLRSMREVFNLGFFEDIKPQTGTPDDSGNIDLIYAVKEKEGVGSIGAGMAYSALDKLTGYIELTHPNIFGRGQRIYTKFEIGGRLTNIQFGFSEPWLFDTR